MTRDKESAEEERSAERPNLEKETVKDLDPAEGDRDVRGGQRTTLTTDANGCNS